MGGKGKNNVMTQQLMDGATLQGGKYRIQGALGQGGFGITYLAVQTGLDRTVAIKEFFMKEWCERDASTSHVTMGTEAGRATVGRFREKFMKEARNIARLEHPNIVRIHDIFEENGTCYYVMDYAGGGSLDDLVKRKGCLPEQEATRYILQVAGALAYVHAQNMTHLDVKPSNILLNDRGEAILIDFGLSKQYDAVSGGQTSTTPVGISEGYAPMEQYRQGGVSEFSPETDIYALGATFFKLLTGKTPPSASVIFEEGVPVQELRSRGVSQAAIAVITQAMESKRKERMKDVQLFISGLSSPASRSVNATVTSSAVDDEATKVVGAENVVGTSGYRNSSRRPAEENSSLSDNERLLVGKWRTQETWDDGVVTLIVEYREYGGAVSSAYICLDTTDEDSEDMQEMVTISVSMKWNWHIRDWYLYTENPSMTLDHIEVKLQGDGWVDDKSMLAEYIEARKKEIRDSVYFPWREEFLADSSEPDKIVSIDRKRLVLESSGEKTEYKRVLNNGTEQIGPVFPKARARRKASENVASARQAQTEMTPDRIAIEKAKQKWREADYRLKEQPQESKSNEDDGGLSIGAIVVGVIVIGIGICVFSAIPPDVKKLIAGLCMAVGSLGAGLKKLFK